MQRSFLILRDDDATLRLDAALRVTADTWTDLVPKVFRQFHKRDDENGCLSICIRPPTGENPTTCNVSDVVGSRSPLSMIMNLEAVAEVVEEQEQK